MSLVRSYSWPFDAGLLLHLLYWPAYTAYDISSFLSVSLAAMRCACVASALKFKIFFTKCRTLKWVTFLVVLAVALRMPVLTISSVAWRIDPETNVSSPYLKASNNDVMSRINDIINRNVIIYIACTTTVICTGLLIFKLYQASELRRSCTARPSQSPDQASDKPVDKGLSGTDLQVVKSVVLVCIIFILSQLPFVLQSTIRLVTPAFDVNQRLRHAFGIFSQINSTCSYLNASVNIFVYYSYNSKFRSVFDSLLPAKRKK
ncbi:chemosensory receptor A [Elysia marginata]|uniref:Chemosensory receptor A n=1 Tax=Elysia marginata TaxID=1093978 RepID=A0AAV4G088_9GAST|nr:chemosensory receptor A [Elysia marginata]